MAREQRRPRGSRDDAEGDERWSQLADLILVISREIQFRGYADEDAVQLTPSEGMVMRCLHRKSAATPGEIASATGLQRTNLSTLLRGLASKGLVERRVSEDDRRGVEVRVTERGTRNYALVRREWADAIATAANHQTRDLEASLALLEAIQEGLIKDRQPN